MEAQEQKQLRAKQTSVVFNQHHQVHLVRHHGNEMPRHRQEPQMKPDPILSLPLKALTVSLCRLQKREKKKEEEQRRKEWVDEQREKTLSRLRSFREVRRSHCLRSASVRR